MKLLIVGGTGNISWRSAQAALAAGWEVTLLNRGAPSRIRRPAPPGCRVLLADIRDPAAVFAQLEGQCFDVVLDVLCYNAPQAEQVLDYFAGRTGHYLFVSTTGMYDRASARLPFTEEAALLTHGWPYAVGKRQAEEVLLAAWRERGFPVTVVRAAHTYDTIVPVAVGDPDWTIPWRMQNHRPILLHGDGTTLWTLTHSSDFARAVMGLYGNPESFGEVFHITSDEVLTWREITLALARALRVDPPDLRYRTSAEIAAASIRQGEVILWHKMWCDIYDNAKIKRFCPDWRAEVTLEQGLAELVAYFCNDPRLLIPNDEVNRLLDTLCAQAQAHG